MILLHLQFTLFQHRRRQDSSGARSPQMSRGHSGEPLPAQVHFRSEKRSTCDENRSLLNIVYLSSEAVPFAKTGGLADVCGTLPSRVAAMGHRTAVIMPAFRSVRNAEVEVETTDDSFAVSMSPNKLVGCRLLTGRLPEGDVPVWFLDQPQYFDRDSLYGTPDGDYPDNAERFAFFCRAALLAIERIGWSVDIVHCNDWQSGLVPALMAAQQRRWMKKAATIFTIHNLASFYDATQSR